MSMQDNIVKILTAHIQLLPEIVGLIKEYNSLIDDPYISQKAYDLIDKAESLMSIDIMLLEIGKLLK